MKLRVGCVVIGFLSLVFSLTPLTVAQTAQTASALPRLVRFGGTVKDLNGSPPTGVVGVTFGLYSEQIGGAPLWVETQNVTADSNGHYTVLLGATKPDGLPADLFTSEQARWVGVQVSGQAEQPRVLLVSAPYALKAGDAETIGGLPPSAFVLAAPPTIGSATASSAAASAAGESVSPATTSDVTTTGGTVNAIPLFSTATNIQNSILTQTAATTLNVGGKLNLPATAAATKTAGTDSRPLDFVASSFSSTTSTAVNQAFQWQAEPAANDTTAPSGTLNLLYGLGATAPSETGLKLSNKGVFTFATGQTFPGTGRGTVKSVGLAAPATDFTVSGSPVTGSGTLNFAWKVAPTNADTANAIVKRDASGNFIAGTITAATLTASSSSTTATTILGAATAITGSTAGVEGTTMSGAGAGVFGQANALSGNGIGVDGYAASTTAVGVYGQNGFQSTTGGGFAGSGVAVWGDGGNTTGTRGVLGTADDGIAGFFQNNSSSGLDALYASANNSSSNPFVAEGAGGNYCYVDSGGDLNCSGAKNAVVPIDGGRRTVAMSAIESPQNWFEDFGSAQLASGVAIVTLDADFIQTVNTEMDYKVFPVPNGDCKGLFVTHKTPTSFEVRELGGGTSSVSFDYRITAVRKNYEKVRFADHTHDLDGHKRMLARAHAAGATNQQSHMPTKKLPPRPLIQTTADR
jgi:hypothetical protein